MKLFPYNVTKMKNLLLLLLFCCFSITYSVAQTKIFTPAPEDLAFLKSVSGKLEKNFIQGLSEVEDEFVKTNMKMIKCSIGKTYW